MARQSESVGTDCECGVRVCVGTKAVSTPIAAQQTPHQQPPKSARPSLPVRGMHAAGGRLYVGTVLVGGRYLSDAPLQ